MKNFVVLLVMMVLIFPNLTPAAPFDKTILECYPEVIQHLHENGFRGPIAAEIGRWATVRYLHENGLERPTTYSVPGIGCGDWTKQIVHKSVQVINPRIRITKVVGEAAAGGQMSLYCLEGEKAHLAGILSVAGVFEEYVWRYSFTEEERRSWKRSQAYSLLLAGHPNNPEIREEYNKLGETRRKVIKKCNYLFGPASSSIDTTVRKFQPLFEEVEKSVLIK